MENRVQMPGIRTRSKQVFLYHWALYFCIHHLLSCRW